MDRKDDLDQAKSGPRASNPGRDHERGATEEI